MKNPQIEAVSILLQETIPEKFIITKENKEKVEKHTIGELLPMVFIGESL